MTQPSAPTAIVPFAFSDPSTTTMSLSTFPLNVLVMILKRVPVKFILRLKCASKPWHSLLSSPEFVSMHSHESARDPMNHCFLIQHEEESNIQTMSLLNINDPPDSEPFYLFNPFPRHVYNLEVVGSINGLVCVCIIPVAREIVIWNRAKWLFKCIELSEKGVMWTGDVVHKLSMGFAYDSVNDDYKVIRLAILVSNCSTTVPLNPDNVIMLFNVIPGMIFKTRAEVYSLKLDDWDTVEIESPFFVNSTRCNVIVKGIPYWIGKIYQRTSQSESTEVLLWFDTACLSFKHVPMPTIERGLGTGGKLVEWKGNLGLIVYTPRAQIGSFVHVLLFDDKERSWNKSSTYGPIPLKMDKILQCSKDGVFLGETHEGKLFLFDPVTNGIKEFTVPRALKNTYKGISHCDSLVSNGVIDSRPY